MGNASRVVAILQELSSASHLKVSVRVASWGNALRMLRSCSQELGFQLIELDPYVVPGRNWLLAFALGLYAYLANTLRLIWQVCTHKPDVVLLDSDYHFIPFLLTRVPIISLGQATEVVRYSRSEKVHRRGWRQNLSFWFCEWADAWVQRIFSRKILVPVLPAWAEENHLSGKVHRIPWIVRREFQGAVQPIAEAKERVCVVTGGSGIASASLVAWAAKRNYPVFSGNRGDWETIIDASRHSRTPMIDRFRVVVTQGGLSSISEVAARGRALLVVPIPDHFEQNLNGQIVEAAGLGRVCHDIEADGDRLVSELLESATPKSLECSGSLIVAREIERQLDLSTRNGYNHSAGVQSSA